MLIERHMSIGESKKEREIDEGQTSCGLIVLAGHRVFGTVADLEGLPLRVKNMVPGNGL